MDHNIGEHMARLWYLNTLGAIRLAAPVIHHVPRQVTCFCPVGSAPTRVSAVAGSDPRVHYSHWFRARTPIAWQRMMARHNLVLRRSPWRCQVHMIRLLACLVLLSATGSSQTWNPAVGFNVNISPNEPWWYGTIDPAGVFRSFGVQDSQGQLVQLKQGEIYPNTYPMIRHNAGSTPLTIGSGGEVKLEPGTMSLDPTCALPAVLRFRAPSTGTYEFTGHFIGISGANGKPSNDTTSTVEIVAQALAQPTAKMVVLPTYVINKFNLKKTIWFRPTLQAGDTVDFIVRCWEKDPRFKTNSPQLWNSDSTGLKLTVTK